jgi:methyl-accepting chemotaxis protein
MENLTSEQIAQIVNAAFDSVELINRNEDDAETIERNVEHLRIMMGEEWFVSALTAEQTEQINAIINE